MSDGTAFSPGQRIGPYKILRGIGAGGMAAVYEAEHLDLGKLVAIKAMHPVFAMRGEIVQRFVLEARAASRLRHPHIPEVSHVGTEGGVPYMVMELLVGEDLRALLDRERSLPLSRVADLLLPIVSAVAAAHEAGVLHRDLKPENIFVTKRRPHGDYPVLLDFGISKLDSASLGAGRLTKSGELLGTPRYMAPEQVRHGMARFSAASDQYALGVILYELSTGAAPFADGTIQEVMLAIALGETQPPSSRNASLPPAWDAVVRRAMSLDPLARFADVTALGRALLDFASPRARALWAEELGGDPPAPAAPAHAPSSAVTGAHVTAADLRVVPALEGCSDAELEMFAIAAPGRSFAAGERLIEQGEVGSSCFLLLSGEIEVTQVVGGDRVVLERAGPGTIIGQVALVDASPRSASVTALRDVVVVELGRELFERLLQTNSAIALAMLENIAVAGIRQLRRATERLAELLDEGGGARSVSGQRRLGRLRASLREWSVGVAEPRTAARRRDDRREP